MVKLMSKIDQGIISHQALTNVQDIYMYQRETILASQDAMPRAEFINRMNDINMCIETVKLIIKRRGG